MTRDARFYADLVCPNDECPGGFGPQAGPLRRHEWTVPPSERDEDAENCSECGTRGVEQGSIDPWLT